MPTEATAAHIAGKAADKIEQTRRAAGRCMDSITYQQMIALAQEAEDTLQHEGEYTNADGDRYHQLHIAFHEARANQPLKIAFDAVITALSAKYERAAARQERVEASRAALSAKRRAQANTHLQEALQFEFKGNMTQAINCAIFAVDTDPDFAFGWFTLGRFNEAERNLEAALNAYQRAATLDPDCAGRVAAECVREDMEEIEDNLDDGDDEDWFFFGAERLEHA